MSITRKEAERTVEIAKQYLTADKFKDMLAKVDREIGDVYLKEDLRTIMDIADPETMPASPSWWVKPVFYVLVAVHYILVVANATSFLLLPFLTPWYIAAPLVTFIFFFSTTKVECKLTMAENHLRKRLGMRKIGGFVGHYFLKPARLLKKRLVKA